MLAVLEEPIENHPVQGMARAWVEFADLTRVSSLSHGCLKR
jgi:hypothetical protein